MESYLLSTFVLTAVFQVNQGYVVTFGFLPTLIPEENFWMSGMGRMSFLSPNQQCQSTEETQSTDPSQ